VLLMCVAVGLGPSPSFVMINLGVVRFTYLCLFTLLLDLATSPPRQVLVHFSLNSEFAYIQQKSIEGTSCMNRSACLRTLIVHSMSAVVPN
jgi:hypothetical protein